jgi:hypothetical protein
MRNLQRVASVRLARLSLDFVNLIAAQSLPIGGTLGSSRPVGNALGRRFSRERGFFVVPMWREQQAAARIRGPGRPVVWRPDVLLICLAQREDQAIV